jgi:hypothetical protein
MKIPNQSIAKYEMCKKNTRIKIKKTIFSKKPKVQPILFETNENVDQ